ncbi:hypothetical protein KAR91_46920 [Candidatus Pacearchaeota archaeon]|nr:hypothetical protein [Candidatus Pacearchaeota archaeon]
MIDEYLKYIQEAKYVVKPNEVLFHGSLQQGLKILSPSKDNIFNENVVWGSWYRPYAAMFALPQRLTNYAGIDCDDMKKDLCDYWTAEITKKNKKFLKNPCSLYSIRPINSIWKRPTKNIRGVKSVILPGAATTGKCEVVKEEKYKSVLDCLQKNKVGVVFMDSGKIFPQKLARLAKTSKKIIKI